MAAYKQTILRVTLGLSPMLAGAWYLAAWLLGKFAPAYVASIWPFRILMLGTFFMFMNQLSSAFIMALGQFRIIMGVALVNLVVYLSLAPWVDRTARRQRRGAGYHGDGGRQHADAAGRGLRALAQRAC